MSPITIYNGSSGITGNRIIDAIKQQLAHEPTVETKNKKMLIEYQPEFEHEPPIRGLDMEQIELTRSREFWEMIRERRKQPTIPLEEVKRRLQDAP